MQGRTDPVCLTLKECRAVQMGGILFPGHLKICLHHLKHIFKLRECCSIKKTLFLTYLDLLGVISGHFRGYV